MLQGLVETMGDAWEAILGALATDPDRALERAARVGAVTAAMHAALAARDVDAIKTEVAAHLGAMIDNIRDHFCEETGQDRMDRSSGPTEAAP